MLYIKKIEINIFIFHFQKINFLKKICEKK